MDSRSPIVPRRALKRSASGASLDSPSVAAGDRKRSRRQFCASGSDKKDNTSGPPRPVNPARSSRTDRVPSRRVRRLPHTRSHRRPETPKTPVQTEGDEAMAPAEDSGGSPVLVESPSNPFVSCSDPSTPNPKPHEVAPVYEEKPTVTYVFRGKKIESTNPLYNLPEEAFKNSRLPVEHEEYSPPPVVKPHRLSKAEIKVTEVFRGKRVEHASPLDSPAAQEAIRRSRPALERGGYSPLAAKLQRLSCNEVRPIPLSPVPAHLNDLETASGYNFIPVYHPSRSTPPPQAL